MQQSTTYGKSVRGWRWRQATTPASTATYDDDGGGMMQQ